LYKCYYQSYHITIQITSEFRNVGDAALDRDAYAMSHNSTLQNLTGSTHALLLDRQPYLHGGIVPVYSS